MLTVLFFIIHNFASSQAGEGLLRKCEQLLANKQERNIAIILDYDGTCTPDCSTSKLIEILSEQTADEFWSVMDVHRKTIDENRPDGEHTFASNAPVWLYSLAKIANERNPSIPLDERFFSKYVAPVINLYPNLIKFLWELKNMAYNELRFKNARTKIHLFIVSAGIRDLIELTFPKDLMTCVYGCRYEVMDMGDEYINFPIAVVDEKIKNQIIMEISKGRFGKS